MTSESKSPYQGMVGYLTPLAQQKIEELISLGFSRDLAIAFIDYQVAEGLIEERDIYDLSDEPG